ncbi:TetR/AcrR family transcriptional regulator [Achromobacter aegrifaciens]|uniref:TetR/AcrR family transcriptional regulator n=1 Tax=Achromobacter aegrifaciens TaxID=1287736 RepID=UPI002790E2A9|nr:TetR/AcrR family transcriptional regulator [Achromobacter aegrifaciens]MDQ1764018.1 TetR/AcrR family transcriptional regulator [Achromobacter aegrifaciens]
MIRAGRELIEQHANLDLVLINDVIRLAGTSIGAFYGRFHDKETFLAAVLDAAVAESKAQADELVRQNAVWAEGSAADIVAAMVDYYVDGCRRNPGTFKAVLQDFSMAERESSPLVILSLHTRTLFVPALARKMPVQAGEDVELDILIAMQMLLGALSVMMLTDPGPMHLADDAIKQQLTERMLRMLRLT